MLRVSRAASTSYSSYHDERSHYRQGVALDIEQSDAVHLLMAAAEADQAETVTRGIETETMPSEAKETLPVRSRPPGGK